MRMNKDWNISYSWSFLVFCASVYTAGSGRTAWSSGAKPPEVVGNIILHDKLDLWTSTSGSVHYHQGISGASVQHNVWLNSSESVVIMLLMFVLKLYRSRCDKRTAVWSHLSLSLQGFRLVTTRWTFFVPSEWLVHWSPEVSQVFVSQTLEPLSCQTMFNSWPHVAPTVTPTPSHSTARSLQIGRRPDRFHHSR